MAQLLDKAKNFAAEKLANIEKPSADLGDVDLKHVSMHDVTMESEVLIDNPYNHDLPICEIKYKMLSAGREIISGTIPDPGSVKAKQKTTLRVPCKVPYNVLMSIMRDIGADWDLDYEMQVGLVVDLPIVGNLTLPLSKRGTLKLPSLKDVF